MPGFSAILFGKFRVERNDQLLDGLEAGKVQELLGYLLIHRERPQPREFLSETIWESQPPAKSKKYLRQTLWKLKSALREHIGGENPDLLIDPEWIQLDPSAGWRTDIAEFEQTYNGVKNKSSANLSSEDYRNMEKTVRLYHGGLLEGWYQEWCILERERFEAMHLTFLNKLIQYCERHHLYEAGLAYGRQLLSYDRAYEYAHRQMMRMFFQSGDRTQALRQFERCTAALHEELGVEPADRTRLLYQQIRADKLEPDLPPPTDGAPGPGTLLLAQSIERLDRFAETMDRVQIQFHEEILLIEKSLRASA